MIGAFCNVRNKDGRHHMVSNLISVNKLDFIGIIETKKSTFKENYLKSLGGNTPFAWEFLPSKRTAGGILIGLIEICLILQLVAVLTIC